MASSRSRSPSPAREEPRPKKQKTGGFKWKEKKPQNSDQAEERDGGRLERGYRNRSPRRESYREKESDRGYGRDRSPRRDRYEDRDREEKVRANHDELSVSNTTTTTATTSKSFPLEQKTSFYPDTQIPMVPDSPALREERARAKAAKKDKPRKDKPRKPAAPSEPMIIVNINDRLGTKAAIPCLASDSIKAFKAVVAAHIGRQPHEIMLKRQGERPFKDQLTLADYGVSNGVQLDLELDTGD